MAIRVNANTAYLSRSSAITATSYTLMFWGRVHTDLNVAYTPCAMADHGASGDFQIISWEGGTANTACLQSNDSAGYVENNFASRPAVGEWAHWFLRCAGTGAGQLTGGFRLATSGTYVTQSATYSGSNTARRLVLNNDLFGGYLPLDIAGLKLYSTALTDAERMQESLQLAPVRWANLSQWQHMMAQSVANAALDASGAGGNFTVNGTPTLIDGPPVPFMLRRRKRAFYVVAAAPAARQQTLSLLGVGA